MAADGNRAKDRNRLTVVVALLAVIIAVVGVLVDAGRPTKGSSATRSVTAQHEDPFLNLGLTTEKGQAPGPSGVGMPTHTPVGYLPVFADNFPASQDVKLGQFSGCRWRGSIPESVCTLLPAATRRQLWAYPAGAPDTSGHGIYEPGQVLTISDGVLRFHLHTNPATRRPVVAAVEPKIPKLDNPEGSIRFGAYAVRFKIQDIPGYEVDFQLFPNDRRWPTDGSIALPAGYTSKELEGVLHWYRATKVSQQNIFSHANDGRWHTAVVQWSPDSVEFGLDGKLLGIERVHIPQDDLHLVLQTQTRVLGPAPAPSRSGDVEVAWVTEYELAPGG